MNISIINIATTELFIILLIIAPPIILPIYCLIDLFKRDFSKDKTQKLILILLILLAPIIGSILYLLMLRRAYPLK